MNESINKSIEAFKLLEERLISEVIDIDQRSKLFNELENKKVALLDKYKNKTITLNIGGKHFFTLLSTVLSENNNLFYNLILTDSINIDEDIFIDRSPKLFPLILSFLRYGNVSLTNLSHTDLLKLKKEALFYEIIPLEELVESELSLIKVTNVTTSSHYIYMGNPLSDNTLSNISNTNDKSGLSGILTSSPGWIIFTLNKTSIINFISVMGYKGNSAFSPGNGANAKIYIGMNGGNWKEAGVIPSGFSSTIAKVKITLKEICNCIKIDHTSYIGLGYFKVE